MAPIRCALPLQRHNEQGHTHHQRETMRTAAGSARDGTGGEQRAQSSECAAGCDDQQARRLGVSQHIHRTVLISEEGQHRSHEP
jgi:hypothetical protein